MVASERSPQEERERRENIKAGAAFVGVVLLVVVGGLLFNQARQVNPELNEKLCPVNQRPTSEIVIIFDATDPWSDIQRTVIRQEFRALQESSKRFARISLFNISRAREAELAEPVIQLCNPGRIEDLGEYKAPFFANPDSIRARWERGFISRLDSVLPKGETAEPQSRLMETVRAAAVTVFTKDVRDREIPGRVYIFSDMLQNSSAYSHYDDARWEDGTGRRLGQLENYGTVALQGSRITIFLLDREIVGEIEGHSRGRLVQFWDEYFSAQDASVRRIRRIEG